MLLFLTFIMSFKSQEDWMLYPKSNNLAKDSNIVKGYDTLNPKESYTQTNGSLIINKDPKIDSLTNYLREKSVYKGYTVQIIVSQINSEIKEKRKIFIANFPEDFLFDEYNAPNIYLYAGKFYSKNEAYHFKEKITPIFKNTMVIPKEFPYKVNAQKKGNQD